MEWHNPFSASPEVMIEMHKAEIERHMIHAAWLSAIKDERTEGRLIAITRTAGRRLMQFIGLFRQLSAPISLPAEPKLATSTGEMRAVK